MAQERGKNWSQAKAKPLDYARATSAPSSAMFALGLVGLLISTAASFVLALEHLAGLSLPGCGADSACAMLSRGPWGKIPGTTWPISFVGFAYFDSALIAWILARGRPSAILRNIARLGLLGSIVFVGVMFSEGHFCQYCAAAHFGNLLFWIAIEKSAAGVQSGAKLQPIVIAALCFGMTSAALGLVDARRSEQARAKSDQDIEDSMTALIQAEKSKLDGKTSIAGTDTTVATPSKPDAIDSVKGSLPDPTDKPPSDSAQAPNPQGTNVENASAAAAKNSSGFTGRFRHGPALSPIRIVMITDYQCPDCRAVENKAREALAQHPEVSISIKHFPMCMDCNPNFKTRNLHPNACWAARAAEAAGILQGDDGFWRMHCWLFDRKGSFTDAELNQGLPELGFDPAQFIPIMTSEETLTRVQKDIQEAIDLGLHYTPMVFINGQPIRGLFEHSAGKLPQIIDRLVARNLPAADASNDHPPMAEGKYIDDVLVMGSRPMPPDSSDWWTGPADANVKLVVWGDYQEPFTAKAFDLIERVMAERGDVAVSFKHYPIDKKCNSYTQMDMFPNACQASRAAEAAGQIGGNEAYWNMHRWLLSHQTPFDPEAIKQAAAGMGLDTGIFAAKMESPEVTAAITQDCQAGKSLGLTSIPMIYINGKFIPRWNRTEDPEILRKIINAVADNRPPTPEAGM